MTNNMRSNHTSDSTTEFKTSDLYFAAFLKTAGVPMTGSQRDQKSTKVHFVFDTQLANLDELKTGYFAGTARVEALSFSNNVKNLKAICHL